MKNFWHINFIFCVHFLFYDLYKRKLKKKVYFSEELSLTDNNSLIRNFFFRIRVFKDKHLAFVKLR